jgi:hypothetical protein
VHDSKVRRIATITPDMACPKPRDLCPCLPRKSPEAAIGWR